MKAFLLKIIIVFILLLCVKINFAQSNNKKNLSKIEITLINKIQEETDSILQNDKYINRFKIKPIFVVYLKDFNERTNSFSFSMSSILNHYHYLYINPSHKINTINKKILIRYNQNTINFNLIDKMFDKLDINDSSYFVKILFSNLNGGEIVGPREAVIVNYNHNIYNEQWLNSNDNLPEDYYIEDNDFIIKLNDKIKKQDSINNSKLINQQK